MKLAITILGFIAPIVWVSLAVVANTLCPHGDNLEALMGLCVIGAITSPVAAFIFVAIPH